NVTVNFIGEVVQGEITNGIPAGYSVRSSMIPRAGSVTDLGMAQLSSGDQVMKLVGTNYSTYTNSSGTWTPSIPSLGVGWKGSTSPTSSCMWNSSYTNSSGTWTPSIPSLGVGESAILWAGTATNLGFVFTNFCPP